MTTSDARKREAERAEQAATGSKSALGAPNSPEAGSGASGETGAILRLEQREALSAAIKDSFYEARDHGRTMHQAAEDERIFAAALAVVREHRAEVWDEGADAIHDRLIEGRWFNGHFPNNPYRGADHD